MDFTTIALIALGGAWFLAGFIAWVPWVVLNGPDRPLTRLAVAVVAAELTALALPLGGVRGVRGLLLSPLLAFAGATLASYATHRWLRSRRHRT